MPYNYITWLSLPTSSIHVWRTLGQKEKNSGLCQWERNYVLGTATVEMQKGRIIDTRQKMFSTSQYISAKNENWENLQTTNAGEGVEKREPSCTAGGNVIWYSHYGEQYGCSLKTKNRTTIWPSNPTTGHIP